jgi:STE24 endopeptidase
MDRPIGTPPDPSPVSADLRARRYHRRQFELAMLALAFTAIYLAVLTVTGAGQHLARALARMGAAWWLQLVLAVFILGAGHRILLFPLDWARGFWLPRQAGLLHQSPAEWFRDLLKGLALGGALGVAGALVVYALLRATAWWWAWSALVFFAGYAMLAWVAPVWLVPLFYRLVPLADVDLGQRLLALARRAGVPVIGAWVADESRKSRMANAAVVGLGRTRRIVLFDTLLREFSPEEIEAVLAHELGHHAHRDVWRGLLVSGVLTLLSFWIVDHALRAGTHMLGLDGPADIGSLPLFGLVLMAVGLLALPAVNGWSRHVEWQADAFALRTTGSGMALARALDRLAALNLAERRPHPLKEAVFHSHPSIARRIEHASATMRHPG